MNTDKVLEITKLDVKSQLPDSGIIVFTGRTESGKTTLIMDILYQYRHKIDIPILMCGSKETTAEFRRHIPGVLCWDGFYPERLQRMYEWLEHMTEMGKHYKVCLIFEDLAYLKNSIANDQTIGRIAFNGRHVGILTMISTQYPKNFGPALRQQTRLCFACAEKSPDYREKIYSAFNQCFYNFNDFDKVMKSCTKNYECLVLNNQYTNSDEITDNVHFYKAKIHTHNWKVAKNGVIWKFDRLNYDPMHFMRGPVDEKKCNTASSKKGNLVNHIVLKRPVGRKKK